MPTYANGTTAAILAVLVVASGVAAGTAGALATGSDAAASAPVDRATERTDDWGAGQSDGPARQDGTVNASTECAATPPDDYADPDGDAVGWENGYWYDESLDADVSDGIEPDEREAVVARTMARVEAVRCIEFDEQVPVSVVSREQFRQQQTNQSVPADFRAFDNGKFEALLLVGEDADSIAVQNRNRGTGVLGFYSPQTDEIVVVTEDPDALRIDELTLAHELVHAWQDQQFDLGGAPFDARLRDRANAIRGLVEGDASYVERLYQRQCGASWDCLDAPPRGGATDLANTGVYMLSYQPYSDGPTFVRLVRNVGGWDAVNALYDAPPTSTEQVIHPERYQSDPPTDVALNDAATGSWERVRPPDRPDYARVGEAGLMTMFVYPYYDSQGETRIVSPVEWFGYNESGEISNFDPLDYESNYTTGWDGDRLHVYENASGEQGYVWRLAWDSPQDAEQFVAGYERLLTYWGGEQVGPNTWRIEAGGFADAFYVDVTDTTVTVVNAPTVGQLSAVRSDVDPVAPTAGDGTGAETTDGEASGNETTAAS